MDISQLTGISTEKLTLIILIVHVLEGVYSAAIQSLPSPDIYGGIWYRAFYNFLTVIAADFKSFNSTLPQGQLQAILSKRTGTNSGLILAGEGGGKSAS